MKPNAKKETEKPLQRSVDSICQFEFYELEYLWAEKRNKETILFFHTEAFDICVKEKDFLSYQKAVFNLYLKLGADIKDICCPNFEKVDVGEETLFFVYDLKQNLKTL